MTQERSPYSGQPVVGWLDEQVELKDADGEDIGDVLEVNPDFLIVETKTGFLGLGEKRTYYVPRSAVAREDGDDWHLGIRRDELESMGWRERPSASAHTIPAYERGAGEAREGRTRIIRYEEELEATTRPREAGEVTVTKDVVEETRTVEVPVRREEVRVERHPVSGQAATAGVGQEPFSGESVRVPVTEEQVEVRKVARPVEEVEISKDSVESTRRVEETVRREEIDIDDSDVSRRRS
jgi:uncharacterized protein (TIGR02271 family)